MTPLEKGTWIVNAAKHIVGLRTNTAELSLFEATEQAGKASLLLARLLSPAQEVIQAQKVKIFARQAGITAGELPALLSQLKSIGKVDYTLEGGKPKDVEVYCFSSNDAITSAEKLFEKADSTEVEQASFISLSKTFEVPSFNSELTNAICNAGHTESTARQTLALQENLGFVKTAKDGEGTLYFNEYAFEGDARKIAYALKGLSPSERQAVEDIKGLVNKTPGLEMGELGEFPSKIVEMMEGVGLLEVVPVHSPHGKASFITLPQQRGISITAAPLSADVFHKVKLMLSCLRYGEVKSQASRGKIKSLEMLLNIVNKLNRGEPVGPCTAIGQDYQLLEKDGVISTTPASNGMYYMHLRQKEIGAMVKEILKYNIIVSSANPGSDELEQPSGYSTPEDSRREILAKASPAVQAIQSKLLHSLRTGSTLK